MSSARQQFSSVTEPGGEAIHASRCHMARNHRQIYNHTGNGGISRGFDSLPIVEVPPKLIRAAVKAADTREPDYADA